MIQNIEKLAQEEPESIFDEGHISSLIRSAVSFLQSINNISTFLRLTAEEEILLFNRLVIDGAYWMKKNPLLNIYEPILRLEERVAYLTTGLRKNVELIAENESFFEDKLLEHDNVNVPSKPRKPELSNAGDADNSWRMEYYESNLVEFNKRIIEIREWSKSGSINFERYIRPNSQVPLEKNGVLLLTALRIAKNGSEDNRNDLLCRLVMWCMHASSKADDLCRAIKILYCDPKKLPDPIDLSDASEDELMQFVSRLNQALNFKLRLNEAWKRVTGENSQLPSAESSKTAYPIPQKTLFDRIPLEASSDRCPLKLDLSPQIERWTQLEAWKNHYMIESKRSFVYGENQTLSFEGVDKLLNEDEEIFRESLTHDLKMLKEDYLEGKRQNEARVFLTIDKPGCDALHGEISGKLEALQNEKSALEKRILKIANKRSADEEKQQRDLAKIGGGVQELILIDDCVECLLSYDGNRFQSKNPNLTEEESHDLANLTLKLEDLKSHCGQLERMVQHISDIRDIPSEEDPSRIYLCQKLAVELDGRYHFDLFSEEEQMIFRVFCGETKMIPYLKQMAMIQKMLQMNASEPQQYRDIVCQLMFGDGKTAVIALLLLYLGARREGRISVFMVPASLFETIKMNLSQSMFKAFRKNILVLDLKRKDLTPYRLKKTLEMIQRLKKDKLPILVQSSTLPIIELEYLIAAMHIKKLQGRVIESKGNLQQIIAKLSAWELDFKKAQSPAEVASLKDSKSKLLKQQNHLAAKIELHEKSLAQALIKLKLLYLVKREFQHYGDVLIDEFDIILDCHLEVNFPSGDTLSIDSTRNLLLFHLYQWMVTDEIAKIVNLHSNDQSHMTPEEYKKIVVLHLACRVADSFEPISANLGEFKEAFVNYLINKIPKETPDSGDPFLNHLVKLYSSGREDQKEFVNLVATARLFLLKLLPETLKNSGNRDYGPKRNDPSGKIVHFLAVDTPATTEFGYHWEEASCNYQWAASNPIGKEQVAEFAKVAMELADYYRQREGEALEETAEFETFFELFNVRLDQIGQPGMLKLAAEHISSDVKKRLQFQYEWVELNITYRSERLSSNGINLLSQISTCRAMSATPWMVEGLPPSLANNVVPDHGTEGKIIDMLIKRDREGKIHTVELDSLEHLMDQILLKHPTPQKIRGITEGGALFKRFKSNARVAEALMKYLAARQVSGHVDQRIIGVLFFNCKPGQEQPDTLSIWRKGASFPEFIGGTTKEHLEAKGLDPTKYFVYIDEGNTTGQDIPQVPDAISLFTFDVKMIRKKLGQGLMRLRAYLLSQDCEIVYTQETKRALFNLGKTNSDLVLASEKEQSFSKTRDMPRYFRKQIEDIFRAQGVGKIDSLVARSLEGDLPAEFAETVGKLEQFFLIQTKDEPFLQFGLPSQMEDTKTILKDHLKQDSNSFITTLQDAPHIEIVSQKATNMEEHIGKATCLPNKWDNPRSQIGVKLEVEVEVDQFVDRELDECKIEEELELELSFYEQCEAAELRKENEVSLPEFFAMLESLREGSSHPELFSLKEILQKYPYGLEAKRIEYDKAFDEPLFGTHAFFYTCTMKGFFLSFINCKNLPSRSLL